MIIFKVLSIKILEIISYVQNYLIKIEKAMLKMMKYKY